MKLVTHTRNTPHKEADQPVTVKTEHELALMDGEELDNMLDLRRQGLDSLANTRVFEVSCSKDGVPTIGKELTE